MNIKGTLWLLPVALLCSCGPAGLTNSSGGYAPGSTGYFDARGVDYLHNGDPYIEARLRETPPASPTTPTQPTTPAIPTAPTQPGAAVTPPAQPADDLRARVKEFEISRFDADQSEPSRFGAANYTIKVFFRDGTSAEFKGRFSGRLHVDAHDKRYHLQGDLTDTAAKDKTTARLVLNDTTTGDLIEISYRAYKARLIVHEDQSKKVIPGSVFDRQLKALRDNTFGWVNNWTVVNGPSFYLVDIIQVVDPSARSTPAYSLPVLSFKGESKRTAGDDTVYEHPAESLPSDKGSQVTASDIKLIGNSEKGGKRLFDITLEDKESQEKNEVMVAVEAEHPDDIQTGADDKPIEYGPDAGNNQSEDNQPDGQSIPIPQPKPANPGTNPSVPVPSPRSSFPYLSSYDLPRSRRMAKDFERNRGLRNVQASIRQFQKSGKGGKRTELQNFFDYAYPFRGIIEALERAYDVLPIFVYLTPNESAYFTGGQYHNLQKADPAKKTGELLAWGPFQIHPDFAHDYGVKVTRNNVSDERNYFVPSACGAATAISRMVDSFSRTDATFAILAYNQGVKGTNTILGRAGAKSQNLKFVEKLSNFNFTYAEIEYAIPDPYNEYVSSALAVYFIAGDMPRYGFSISPKARRNLPTNGSLVPPKGISNAKCRAAISSALAI